MDDVHLLQELESLAAELAVEVRRESLDGPRGGLCRLGGHDIILVDRSLPLAERVDLMARSLARLSLDDVFMAPAVRRFVQERACQPHR